MANGFRYEFAGNELFYFLFRKKKCRRCGGKIKKSKCSEIVDGTKYDAVFVPLYIKGREIKKYYYIYTCKKCGAKFTLTELAK